MMRAFPLTAKDDTSQRQRVSIFIACAALVLFGALAASAAVLPIPEIITSDDQTTVIINDAPEQELIVIGKSVIVTKRAKGVLAVGGDVVIEGRVEGDVATVGGNVIQKQDAYVGGDIIVFGGAYRPESDTPQRAAGKETVTFGVFEEELRSLGQQPSQILSPEISLNFLARRLLLALFWFVVSITIATIAPGAVGRAVARLNLSFARVAAVGAGVAVLGLVIMLGGVATLPDYLSITLGMMSSVLIILGYVFGRVTLQVFVGKAIQKRFLDGDSRSETVAILIGVLAVTLLLSLPYIWVAALFLIFAVGTGLVITGRASPKWQNP